MQTLEQLTDKQRKTLNDAEQILIGLLRSKDECLMFSLHHGWDGLSTTYFTPCKVQHGSIWCGSNRPTLADKIDRVLAIRAEEDAHVEDAKAKRIAALRAELERLSAAPMDQAA